MKLSLRQALIGALLTSMIPWPYARRRWPEGNLVIGDMSTTFLHGATAKHTPVGADELIIADSEALYVNKKCTITELAALMEGTTAGSGLTETAGVMAVDIHDTTLKAAPIAADELMIYDSAGTANKKTTITDLAIPVGTILAGVQATSGLSVSAAGVIKADPTVVAPTVAADYVVFQAADETQHKVLITGLLTAILGTVATSGLSHSSGVMKIDAHSITNKAAPVVTDEVIGFDAIGSVNMRAPLSALNTLFQAYAQLPADQKSSLFFLSADDVNYSSSASLVAVKISDHAGTNPIPAKGQLVAALVCNKVANAGGTASVISLAKDGTPTAKMTADWTITVANTDHSNTVGNARLLLPVAGANSIVNTGEDIYIVGAADTSRTDTGRLSVLLIFMKTA
jgi:hypothetical protein